MSMLVEVPAGQPCEESRSQRFGRNWGKEAGTYLHDKFLIRGGSLTLEHIMQQGTDEGLKADYLITALKAAPAAPGRSASK
jgi:hypothetical protein